LVNNLNKAGYTIKDSCEVVGISRSYYYSKVSNGNRGNYQCQDKSQDKEIISRVKEIKTKHPFWGYRRITAWLVHREKIKVNHKRVYRLMKENGLTEKVIRKKAFRGSNKSKPQATKPSQYWGIDMTKFIIPGTGWAYLEIVLDWYTKKIVGWELAIRGRTSEWKAAMEMAISNEFPSGVRGKGLKLVSDNGSQPTSTSFIKEMSILQIVQIFTSYNNPKGNAETERMMRTIKEEVVWLEEFKNLEEAREKIGSWIEEYNTLYVHSSLGYMSPIEFENAYFQDVKAA
jgi:putative transposase